MQIRKNITGEEQELLVSGRIDGEGANQLELEILGAIKAGLIPIAVNTLLGWYRDGVCVPARLPVLSTYLRHRNPSYTYYYLSAAPELLAHAAGLLDTAREVTR